MILTSEAIRAHFQNLGARIGLRGPTGEVIAILARGEYDPAAFADVRTRHGVEREDWFRGQLLDLIFGVLATQGDGEPLAAELIHDLTALGLFLHVEDGEFLRLKPNETAAVLGAQWDLLLADGEITDSEDLYQVELQDLFGLSYDQYVMLIRPAIERAWARLQAPAPGEFGSESRRLRLRDALQPLYELARSQPRTLGTFY